MDDKNFSVLVVDDEAALRSILKEILLELNYSVYLAEDGYEALQKIKNEDDIDIVLTDIKMPRMDGLELVRNLKSENSDIIPIMMTGYIDSEILVSVLRAGAYDFIPKPFDAQAVELILKRSVKKRKMILDNKRLMKKLKSANKKLKDQSEKLKQKVVIGDKILEKKYEELKYISETMKKINSSMDYKKTIHFILNVVKKVIGSNRASIMLMTEDKKHLKVVDMIGSSFINEKVSISNGVAGWVAKNNELLYVKDRKKVSDDIKKLLKADRYEARSFVSLPLNTVKRGLIGILNVTKDKEDEVITEEEVDILKIFSQQAAAGIESSLTYEELENHYLLTIKALSNAIEAKDEYTRGHAERVTEYAVELAKQVGYSGEDIRTLKFAGILHDIGKIGVPAEILGKPAKLTDKEYDLMKRHPEIGESIVEGIDFLEPCLKIIRNHHERIDGKGYPDGLKGEQIPGIVKVLTVADAFDAMTSDRPYRKALSVSETVKRLKINKGKQFDSKLVGIFIEKVIGKFFNWRSNESKGN